MPDSNNASRTMQIRRTRARKNRPEEFESRVFKSAREQEARYKNSPSS
jgi:hypothetical protein